MSHQARRNKRHTPRHVNPLGAIGVIAGIHASVSDGMPLDPHALTDLGIAYWAAFHQMVKGKSSEQDWTMVTCALNIALVLSERGFGKECEGQIITALDGAFRSWTRAQQTGAWRYDGAAMNAIREALEIHDIQVPHATQQELREAFIEVTNRVAQGNVYQEATWVQ